MLYFVVIGLVFLALLVSSTPKKSPLQKRIQEMFQGKRVVITHNPPNPRIGTIHGTCRKVTDYIGGERGVDFDLHIEENQHGGIGFSADTVGEGFVEGPLKAAAGGRRRIEIEKV